MYCHFALIPKITLGELQSRFFYCIKFDCRTKIKKHKNNVLNCGRSTRYSMAEAVRFVPSAAQGKRSITERYVFSRASSRLANATSRRRVFR